MKLQEFCGAFAVTEEKCPRSLMETVQVICAGRVDDSHLNANQFTFGTITNAYLFLLRIKYFLSFLILQNAACFVLKYFFPLCTVFFDKVAREWNFSAVHPGWFMSV